MTFSILIYYQDWLSDTGFAHTDQNLPWMRPRSLKTSGLAYKHSSTPLSIRQIHSWFTTPLQKMFQYHHWVTMMSLTIQMMVMIWSLLTIHWGHQMALSWMLATLRTSPSSFCHHLDGNGVHHIMLSPLQWRKLSSAMLKLMMQYINFALLWGSSLHSSALRFDLLTPSRWRLAPGMLFTMLTALSLSMLGFIAWHTMHIGISATRVPSKWNFRLFIRKTCA